MSCIPGPKVSVSWQRVARTADGIGGYTEAWTQQEAFKAVVGHMSASEALRYSKDTVTNLYIMYASNLKANGTARAFREQDRIVIGSQTLEIIGLTNIMMQGDTFKLDLREVQ